MAAVPEYGASTLEATPVGCRGGEGVLASGHDGLPDSRNHHFGDGSAAPPDWEILLDEKVAEMEPARHVLMRHIMSSLSDSMGLWTSRNLGTDHEKPAGCDWLVRRVAQGLGTVRKLRSHARGERVSAQRSIGKLGRRVGKRVYPDGMS